MTIETKYIKVRDKRKKLFGIKIEGHKDWNERTLTGDEGQSWDECIHYPAYQDEYFTMPFHHLFCDCFDYSFEDLCNINDFRVNVNVRLVTKEQD